MELTKIQQKQILKSFINKINGYPEGRRGYLEVNKSIKEIAKEEEIPLDDVRDFLLNEVAVKGLDSV